MAKYKEVIICDALQVAIPDCKLPIFYSGNTAEFDRRKDAIVISRQPNRQDYCIVYPGLEPEIRVYNGSVNTLIEQLTK